MASDQNRPKKQFTSLTEMARHQTRGITGWLGETGARLGINPDVITVLGLVIVLVAAVMIAQGQFLVAGITLILGMPLDALDGAIARAMNRKDRFGALLDSSLDRYADAFIYSGIAYYYASRGDLNTMLLAMIALIGAYGVSYVRARAEGLNIGSIKDGLFDRMMRTIILILMLLTGLIVPGLIILAVGNHLTAVQRMVIVYRMTRSD